MIENRISDRAKILLIDEDTSISYLIRRAMEKENYKIYIAGSGKQGMEMSTGVCPDLILMDEPTSALDPISTSKIEDLAVELKKKYTIIMVTHNMQQAVRVSDKTVFFLLGEVIESGDTEKLFSVPQDKRTEDYITGRFG